MILRIKILSLTSIVGYLSLAAAGPATESYKGQYCTDPRTMLQHPAYTEWADAYSCTRHRCQPGGRNLAIYTVGCKRVEAPESAIECEEVVEDTNMQFPFCCTRLRCLVVVRGEVWTRVLGQPWETLPAAPWSHMYKMKRPPPGGDPSIPHIPPASAGPIYELAKPEEDVDNKVLRRKPNRQYEQPAQSPDIVIALETNNEHEAKESRKKPQEKRHRRGRKNSKVQQRKSISPMVPDDTKEVQNEEEEESQPVHADKEKQMEPTMVEPRSEEREREAYATNSAYASNQKKSMNFEPEVTDIPPSQWNEVEQEHYADPETIQTEAKSNIVGEVEKAEAAKSGNLQALVDAIGNRMRDIEHVVRRMNDKAEPRQPESASDGSQDETKIISDTDMSQSQPVNNKKNGDYRRAGASHFRGKYVPPTTEPAEESALGFYSDASNAVLHQQPKPVVATYMAPVETRRRARPPTMSVSSGEEKTKKKRMHKKKKSKGHHKKHHNLHNKEDKRKRFNKMNSVEVDKKTLSFEDSAMAQR